MQQTEKSAAASTLPKRIFWWLMGITIFLLAAHLTLQYLNVSVYNEKHGQVYELSNRFDMDDEVSLPSWFAQFTLMIGGVTALLAAVLSTKPAIRKLWRVIGIVGVIFSIDEGAGLHEFVLQSLHLIFFGLDSPTTALNAWWIILPVVAGAGLWLLWYVWRQLPARTFVLLGIGGVMYLTGVVVLDLISGEYKAITFMYQGLLTGAEETLELLGSIIVVYANTSYIATHHAATVRAAWRKLAAGSNS